MLCVFLFNTNTANISVMPDLQQSTKPKLFVPEPGGPAHVPGDPVLQGAGAQDMFSVERLKVEMLAGEGEMMWSVLDMAEDRILHCVQLWYKALLATCCVMVEEPEEFVQVVKERGERVDMEREDREGCWR